MNTQKSQTQPNDFWENVRESLVSGVRDLRDRGDDLARLGRLRMDLIQAQRRLRNAYESLGEAAHDCLKKELSVECSDPRFMELCERVNYYTDEIARLQRDLKTEPHRAE
jgi:hypothetical protein